jgi:hypothetical protein
MTEATAERPTYGNWILSRSPGLFGAGMLGTVVLFAGLLAALLTLLAAGPRAAAVVAVMGALGFTAVGTPVGSWIARRVGFLAASRSGDTTHRSGVFTKKDDPGMRLPGLLGRTQLLTASDAFTEFVVVKSPGGLYSMVLRCSAEGPNMQDQSRVDAWVAQWANLLSAAGQESGLVSAKAITDTAPDPGGRLPVMVSALRSPNSPTLAQQVMAETVADLPAASSDNVTYLEMTFRGRQLNRKGEEKAILSELARKAVGVVALATYSGGGHVEMLKAPELIRLVRESYDPVTSPALEQAELHGDPEHLTWADAGPVASRDLWGELVHDSGRSITWEMYGAPRSKITENALTHLLTPHADFARKRVALLYRPHGPDESAKVAERDANTANFVAQQSKKRPSASAQLVQRAAEQSRQEVAAGAASVRFSLLVTVTCRYDGDVAQAVSTLEARGRAVPLRLRRVFGAQAAAFAATLPVGFVPWEHTAITPSVREWL